MHGFPDSHHLWRHQVPALTSAGFRCVAPTLRGFGASDRPEGGPEAYHPAKHVGDLLELLARLDVDRFHLVGHDWGSGVAQGLAHAVTDRVRSLSLLSVGHLTANLEAGWEQRQRSWYMLLFQLAGVAEDWLARDDFAQLREMLAEHPDAESVIERCARRGADGRPERLPGGAAAGGPVRRGPVGAAASGGRSGDGRLVDGRPLPDRALDVPYG